MREAVAGRIVVIGWGSLIWDLDDLAAKVEGGWLMGVGPVLPFEFSRISPKRKMGLVLCIDPIHGAPCRTSVIVSAKQNIHEAAEDLRLRERAPATELIGACCARTGFLRSRVPEAGAAVTDWLARSGAAGAVWTDLESNFEAVRGEAFSLARALAYLAGLTGESRAEAERYIAEAPALTDTPLRRQLATRPVR